jgi:hypothetical protein
MDFNWRPAVGDWVVYNPGYGAPREDGTVTEVIDDKCVRVRYRGDTTAKLTYVRDLERGNPSKGIPL